MSAGDFTDMENCSLLEKEASRTRGRISHGSNRRARYLESSTWSRVFGLIHAISGRLSALHKGGTQILRSSTPSAKFVCSLPLALTEKVGGWVNQAMLGFEMGVPQIWSRCVQALGLTAQSLRKFYLKRLHPFLVGLSLIIQMLAVLAWAFTCLWTMLIVLVTTPAIIMGSTPFGSESDRQIRSQEIKVFSFQAVIASATFPFTLYQYRINGGEYSSFLAFAIANIEDKEHALEFFQMVTTWAFCFFLGLAGGVQVCFMMLLYTGAELLLALLLYCGYVFITSIVTWIGELCSRFIFYMYVVVNAGVGLLAPGLHL